MTKSDIDVLFIARTKTLHNVILPRFPDSSNFVSRGILYRAVACGIGRSNNHQELLASRCGSALSHTLCVLPVLPASE